MKGSVEMDGERDHRGWMALGLIAVLTVVRLWVCSQFELIGDEAYYWRWSRHLDWCYYSKGPLVAWTIWLGTQIFGDTVLGIRFFSVGLGSGTLLLLYRLTRRVFSPRVAWWTLIMAACTPLFVIGSLLMTIDPIFIFFWLAAATSFWQAKDSDRVGPWVLTGALVGIGMLAKYTNVALLPSFALFLAWTKPYRVHLRRPTFWLMCLAALLFLTPVLWWNARHEWITLVHLQERGALDQAWRFSASEFLEYLGAQVAVYTPFFLVGILFSLIHGGVRRQAPVAYRFLASLVLPLLGLYTLLALNDAGEANWTAPAIMSGLPLLAAAWLRLADRHRGARVVAAGALPLAGLAALLILIAPAVRIPKVDGLLYRVRGWKDLATQVERIQKEEALTFVIGGDYQCASLMTFYREGHPDAYIPHRPGIQNQYSFWPTYGPERAGQDAIYLSRHDRVPDELRTQFGQIEPARKVWRHWKGRPVKPYYLFACRGLHLTTE
ncbi:MAG: glycosyltransferase family 39 protein [Verrucomicrobia bacterium]|nr:glycosyltransferase family 39 protein [Verrucomicrobiota bacterium]MBT7065382.1 glycosyltransferase family 39 protein [Verrucomicrobiota bacterium]MBT7701312.1 glycosyltransferase family 39 protein [Verrucomicrobiota bacterium]